MKKFLFTLAALLMAGTAFAAENYLYVPDFEVPQSYIGTGEEYEMVVSAHFDQCVSAWDVYFTYPEGMVCTGVEKGDDWIINTFNNRGNAIAFEGPLYGALAPFDHLITAIADAGYNEDKSSYGCVKWWAGDYEEYLIMYFTFDESFKGGEMTINTVPSCGEDNREGFVPATPEDGATKTTAITVEQAQQKEDCESPSVMGATGENGTYYIQITPDPETDGELKYTVDVEPVSTETIDGIVYLYYNRGEEDVTVHVEAWTEEGDNYNASEKEIKDIVVPALEQVKTPNITWTPTGDGKFEVTATCETEGATVVLYDPEGNAVEMPAEVTYDIYEGYNGTWTAKATAPYMLDSETAEKEIVIAAETKKECDSPAIIGMPDDDGVHYNIYIYPDERTDGELQYTANPAPGAKVETLVYTRGAEPYNVHVEAWTAEGATYQASDVETADITVPALDQVKKPEITWTMGEEPNTFVVSATSLTEGATVTLYDPEGNATFNPVTVTYDPEEGYNGTWTAKATKENMLDSEVASKLIEIAPEHQPVIYYVDDPVIGEPTVNDEDVTVVVTGEGHIVVTVTMGTETLTFEGDETVNVVIPRGEEDDFAIINAVATVDPVPAGYDEVQPGRATSDLIDIPALEPEPGEKPGVPEVTQTMSATTVVVSADADNATEVHIFLWDPEANDGEGGFALDEDGNPIEIDNPSVYNRTDEEQSFYVVAQAVNANGETWSDPAPVIIPAKSPETALDELTNGKTVAGVRYFNMAGQEMQEANGITIVVTTYTDGTTSAVKVIK